MRLLCLAAAATLLVAACGSGRPTKDEYVAEVNGLCRVAQEQVDRLPRPTDPQSLITYLDGVSSAANRFIDRVDQIKAPEGDATRINQQFVMPFRQDLAAARPAIDKIKEAARTGDNAAINRAAQNLAVVPDLTASENAFLRDYGLTDCVAFNSATGPRATG